MSITRVNTIRRGSLFSRLALLHVLSSMAHSRLFAGSDGVHIAGKVQVDVLHRHDLRVAAAAAPPLMPNDRTEDGSRSAIMAFCPVCTVPDPDRPRSVVCRLHRQASSG